MGMRRHDTYCSNFSCTPCFRRSKRHPAVSRQTGRILFVEITDRNWLEIGFQTGLTLWVKEIRLREGHASDLPWWRAGPECSLPARR